MNKPITIELYRPEYLSALQNFIQTIQDTEASLVKGLTPGLEIREWYSKHLLDSVAARQGVILMAMAGAEPAGFVCVWVEDDDNLVLDAVRKSAYISDICVGTNWRRMGIAAQLLNAAENHMRSLGCRRIRLCAKSGNLAAIKCYEQQNYESYEIVLAKSL